MLSGRLITNRDIEFHKRKQFFFNAVLHSFNPRAFAEVENVEDVKSAVKYCQEKNVSISVLSLTNHKFPNEINSHFLADLPTPYRL